MFKSIVYSTNYIPLTIKSRSNLLMVGLYRKHPFLKLESCSMLQYYPAFVAKLEMTDQDFLFFERSGIPNRYFSILNLQVCQNQNPIGSRHTRDASYIGLNLAPSLGTKPATKSVLGTSVTQKRVRAADALNLSQRFFFKRNREFQEGFGDVFPLALKSAWMNNYFLVRWYFFPTQTD